MARKRGKLCWWTVAALRLDCPVCGAPAGTPCLNYKGKAKGVCTKRHPAWRSATADEARGELTQKTLFRMETYQ